MDENNIEYFYKYISSKAHLDINNLNLSENFALHTIACSLIFSDDAKFLSSTVFSRIDTVIFTVFSIRVRLIPFIINTEKFNNFFLDYIDVTLKIFHSVLGTELSLLKKILQNRTELYAHTFKNSDIDSIQNNLLFEFEHILFYDYKRDYYTELLPNFQLIILGIESDILCSLEIKTYYNSIINTTNALIEEAKKSFI